MTYRQPALQEESHFVSVWPSKKSGLHLQNGLALCYRLSKLIGLRDRVVTMEGPGQFKRTAIQIHQHQQPPAVMAFVVSP